MADIKISQLPAASALGAADTFEVVQAGANRKATGAQVAALTPRGYIDGLSMEWVSGTSLRVTSGAAFIPGRGSALELPSAVTKSGLSLAANTWYHVYLFDNAGNADVEVVTTAPAAPYIGTARAKTGDTSRRYVGSVRTGASNQILRFTHDSSSQSINYVVDLNTPPLLLVSNGTTANGGTGVAVSCASAVPVTAKRLLAFFENTGSNIVFISTPELGAPSGNILSFLRAGAMVNGFIVINDNKEFSYSTGAGAIFQCFCAGYTYER